MELPREASQDHDQSHQVFQEVKLMSNVVPPSFPSKLAHKMMARAHLELGISFTIGHQCRVMEIS